MGAETPKDQKGIANPAQVMLDRLGKMPPAAQQAWLRHLEERAVRAAQLTLDPDEVVRQQTRIHAELHRKVITWPMLRALIDETNMREKSAIDRLVRRYGNLVFDTFHKQNDLYNQRRQAWLDIYVDWEQAGKPIDQQDRLIDWLEAAIRSATAGTIAPIPGRPTFENEEPPAKAAAKPPAETKPSEAAKPDASAKPKTEEQPPNENPASKSPAETKPKELPALDSTDKPKSEKPKTEEQKPAADPASKPPADAKPKELPALDSADKPKSEKPKAEEQKPAADPASKRSTDETKPQESPKPKTSEDADKKAAKTTPPRAAEPPLASPEPAAASPKSSSFATQLPLRRHEFGQPAVDQRRPMDVLGTLPVTLARRNVTEPPLGRDATPPLPRRPAVAIAVSLPKVVEPVLQEAPVLHEAIVVKQPRKDYVSPASFRGPATETAPAISDRSPASGPSPADAVEIKPDELAARIRGCNLAFRALEAEVDETDVWTAARLEPLVERLQILVVRRNDLDLFCQLVPKEQRSSIEALAPAKGVVSPVAAGIVAARSRAAGAEFKGTEAERQGELRRLEELSRRLAALAGK